MNVRDALLARKSVRAFFHKPVVRDLIERILDAARHAPRSADTQPWQVAVVTGRGSKQLSHPARRCAYFHPIFRRYG